jgi:hypothetical protein
MTGILRDSVANPEVPLAEAVQLVRRLDGALAGRSDWIEARISLAHRLDDAGLTQAAKAEYASIATSPVIGLTDVNPALLDDLAVDEASLLLAMGDRASARKALDRRSYPRDPAQFAALAALRLQADGTAMLPAPLLAALKVEDASGIADPAVQLELAKVAAATGEMDAALAAYDRGLSQADQTERLTASLNAALAGDGDRAEVQKAAVKNLAAPRRAGERLSVSGASALITAAADAGQAVDALLAKEGS